MKKKKIVKRKRQSNQLYVFGSIRNTLKSRLMHYKRIWWHLLYALCNKAIISYKQIPKSFQVSGNFRSINITRFFEALYNNTNTKIRSDILYSGIAFESFMATFIVKSLCFSNNALLIVSSLSRDVRSVEIIMMIVPYNS